MSELLVMEEFHVTVLAPRGLLPSEYDAIRQTLINRGFRAQLRRAVLDVVRQSAELQNNVKVTITR